MLSRRRSSEQTHQQPVLQSSPSLARLESSLRGVHVLFSVITQPDAPPTQPQRPNLTNPTETSQTPPSPTLPTHDVLLPRRRLFSRDTRADRLRRGATFPPVHRLVVASARKNPSYIRLFQLLDYPSVPRVSVSRTWNLSDLRKIDGLGLPVSESLRFGLFFANGKILIWRTHSPLTRAVFLWSLLQTCVSRLKRAPPVTRLRLLDLQTFADNPYTPTVPPDPEDDESSSINYPPSDRSNVRLASSLDELHDAHPDEPIGSSSVHSPHSSVLHPLHSQPRGSKPSSQDAVKSPLSNPSNLTPVSMILSSTHAMPLHRPTSPNRASNPPARSTRDPGRSQRVIRALSEPKVSAAVSKFDESCKAPLTFAQRKAETMGQPLTVPDADAVDMDMDERAFLAAAKRMGAKQSAPMCKAEILEQFANVGTDPKARIFQNFLHGTGCSTRKSLSEQRLNNELKLFRLSKTEQKDLSHMLDLFVDDSPHSTLSDFGSWAEKQIQALEVENIADIVNAEERDSCARNPDGGPSEDCNPFDVLINSVMQVEPWLEKSETLLSPYASLADDINNEVIMLELQRKNVVDLEEQLDEMLKAITFKPKEQELISDLDTMELSPDPLEVNYTEFCQAVEVVSDKVEALSTLSKLADMAAVTQVRQLIAEKQTKASNALLPCLQKFLTVQYRVTEQDEESFSISAEDVRLNMAEVITSHVFSEFFKGARCLFMCGNNSFAELIDHYVSVSASWIQSVVRFVKGNKDIASVEKNDLDDNATNLLESMFYACLSEGFRAFRLFASILESSSDQGDATTLSIILRRQIPDVSFIEENTSKVAAGNSLLQACLLLHFSYLVDVFVERLQTCTGDQLQEIVARIEAQIGLEPTPSAVGFSYSRNWFDSSNFQSSDWSRSPSSVYARSHRSTLSREGRVVTEFLNNFLPACQKLSLGCYGLVEKRVTTVIAQMATPRDISDGIRREAFFSMVKESVDLCRELASPTFQGPADVMNVGLKTKSLCEKLIAAAMRNTEVASANGPKNSGDIVKLQCYGYIAARLSNSEEEFLIQLAHLSSRVRKHVMKKWAEDHVFDVVLGGLNVEMVKRSSTAGQMKLRECIAALKASEAAMSMKKLIDAGMESAAETCAIVPLYNELVIRTKERMEEVLRHVRKDKSISDMRPRLLSFSRELLALLKGELRKSQTRFSGAISGSPL